MSLELVKVFHRTMQHPINNIGEEDTETKKLRVALLYEELKELAIAGGTDTQDFFLKLVTKQVEKGVEGVSPKRPEDVGLNAELDACADLRYVLDGKILTAGFQDVFERAFSTVHADNMNKLCTPENLQPSIDAYTAKGLEVIGVKTIGDRYILKVVSGPKAGKIVKPLGYKETSLNIKELLRKYEFEFHGISIRIFARGFQTIAEQKIPIEKLADAIKAHAPEESREKLLALSSVGLNELRQVKYDGKVHVELFLSTK